MIAIIVTAAANGVAVDGSGCGSGTATVKLVVTELPMLPRVSFAWTVRLCEPFGRSMRVRLAVRVTFSSPARL